MDTGPSTHVLQSVAKSWVHFRGLANPSYPVPIPRRARGDCSVRAKRTLLGGRVAIRRLASRWENWCPNEAIQQRVGDHNAAITEVESILRSVFPPFSNERDSLTLFVVAKLNNRTFEPFPASVNIERVR